MRSFIVLLFLVVACGSSVPTEPETRVKPAASATTQPGPGHPGTGDITTKAEQTPPGHGGGGGGAQ
jgi:hypothetical protein